MKIQQATLLTAITRREALCRMGSGFGMLSLAALVQNSLTRAAGRQRPAGPLDVKATHFPAKANLNGGLSQVDTFDPKPMLDKYHGQPLPGGNPRTERKTSNLMRSPFTFRKYGRSRIEVSEIFSNVGESIDEFCVIRSMHTNVPNHEPSLFMMNCGDIQPGRPSMRSWTSYGLGTENQNLPGFVVLCPGTPVVGPPLWNSAFLPAVYQGTSLATNESDPNKLLPFIRNKELDLVQQRRQLDLIGKLNQLHLTERTADPQLEASIESMEIAFRMQTEAPEAFDLSKQRAATRERYGESDFARGCLMALRLVEQAFGPFRFTSGMGSPGTTMMIF